MELKQYQGALEAILFAHGEPIGTDRLAQALELRELCGRYGVPLILNDAIPEEHKDGIDMGRDLLRRSMCWWSAAIPSPRP